MIRRIDTLIIHCSDTPDGRWTTTADIDRWHAERGFRRDPRLIGHHEPRLKHIGYHYVIYTTGAVANGRSAREIGAHCRGHNARSLGVCLIGRSRYTQRQWESLAALVEACGNAYPHITVHGHREFDPGKTCPGFDVAAWLEGGMKPLPEHLLEEAQA